jgi:hypothetical protein
MWVEERASSRHAQDRRTPRTRDRIRPCLATSMVWRALLSLSVPFWLAIFANGSALTTPIAPNERLCFYADVDKAGEKIGVRDSQPYSMSFD